MKFLLSLVVVFSSFSAWAAEPDFAFESAGVKAALKRAMAVTGGYCDFEDIERRPAGYNIQVYCNRTQSFLWYFVKVKRCRKSNGESYLWTSSPRRLSRP